MLRGVFYFVLMVMFGVPMLGFGVVCRSVVCVYRSAAGTFELEFAGMV